MKKYFVFSDVHGEWEALKQSLLEAGYDSGNPQHVLVSIGDNFDRGPDSKEVYSFLTRRHAICIKGNHETFLEEALEKGMDGEYVFFNILHNGLYETICSFANIPRQEYLSGSQLNAYIDKIKIAYPGLLKWIKSMPLIFETKNYIFVHAGVNPDTYPGQEQEEKYMLWDIKDSHRAIPGTNKTVVIGHHHAEKVRDNIIREYGCTSPIRIPWVGCQDENGPVQHRNKIAIDPCSNLTHKINVLIIEDEPLDTEERAEEDKVTYGSTNDALHYTIHMDPNNPFGYTIMNDGINIGTITTTNQHVTTYVNPYNR